MSYPQSGSEWCEDGEKGEGGGVELVKGGRRWLALPLPAPVCVVCVCVCVCEFNFCCIQIPEQLQWVGESDPPDSVLVGETHSQTHLRSPSHQQHYCQICESPTKQHNITTSNQFI